CNQQQLHRLQPAIHGCRHRRGGDSRMERQVTHPGHAHHPQLQQLRHHGGIADPRAGCHAAIVHRCEAGEKHADDAQSRQRLGRRGPEFPQVDDEQIHRGGARRQAAEQHQPTHLHSREPSECMAHIQIGAAGLVELGGNFRVAADHDRLTRGAPVRYSYATHLECSVSAQTYDIAKLHGLSAVNKPLLARYDLDALRRAVSREEIAARPAGLWRWRELLPVAEPAHIVSLGEVETPLLSLSTSRRPAGFMPPLVKDEARLPTGSFKARGLCVAVSMAKAHGVQRIAIPTNGNAGAALAAYAARAGIEAYCFCPDDTPEINLGEIALQGATVWRVNGLINDCARLVEAGKPQFGWFDMSTLKEPYRIEG